MIFSSKNKSAIIEMIESVAKIIIPNVFVGKEGRRNEAEIKLQGFLESRKKPRVIRVYRDNRDIGTIKESGFPEMARNRNVFAFTIKIKQPAKTEK